MLRLRRVTHLLTPNVLGHGATIGDHLIEPAVETRQRVGDAIRCARVGSMRRCVRLRREHGWRLRCAVRWSVLHRSVVRWNVLHWNVLRWNVVCWRVLHWSVLHWSVVRRSVVYWSVMHGRAVHRGCGRHRLQHWLRCRLRHRL